eukprot:7798221-Lingulodinium_polyedra.AAC.1
MKQLESGRCRDMISDTWCEVPPLEARGGCVLNLEHLETQMPEPKRFSKQLRSAERGQNADRPLNTSER